jgi:predicted PurR-regulated permease PerM
MDYARMDDVASGRIFGLKPQPPSDHTEGRKISVWDGRTVRVLLTAIAFAAVGAFCYGAWKVIVALLFAIFLAYLLEPLVSLVQRRSPLSRGSRGRAILQVYIVLGILLSLLFLFAGPKLVNEGQRLAREVPVWMDQLTSGKIVLQIGSRRGWSQTTQEHVQHWLSDHRQEMLHWAGRAGSYVASLVANAIWLILVPILAIFFLRDGRAFADSLVEVVDRRRQRQFLSALLDDLDTMFAHYIRAQLILTALTMVVFTVVLALMGLSYGIVLGVLGGVFEFIPLVGPLVAAALILGVAFFTSYHHILILAIFLGAWRLVQDYVNAPRIMGKSLELHPLAALFAILAGGEIAGIIGVYLSIPIAATLRIFWRRWRTFRETNVMPSNAVTEPPIRRHGT